ncbi:WDHD1 protein, partial [Atlantisia rogersi]|nr:WDHD1 protein [Atlantisia rogersi]
RMKHEKNYSVCGLAWHPKHRQIAYTDTEGNLGLLENIGDGKKPNDKVVASTATKDYDDLFDGDDDDCLNGDMIEPQSSPKTGPNEDDDDHLMPTSGHLRRAIIDDDDDNSLDIGMIKATSNLAKEDDNDDDQTGGLPALPPSSAQQPFYNGPMPTPKQKPFQSGSTPAHLMHRFMV